MKPVIIILHGALGCAEQFREWKKVLDEEYDCHLMDFFGHGSRSADQMPFLIERFSEDLKKFIKQNNLKQPHVLGYSMGGYIALYTALLTKDILGKIMTVATKFDWYMESAKKEASYLQPQLMQTKVPQLVEQLKKNHGELYWPGIVKKTAEMMLHLGENPLLTEENIKNIKNNVKLCVGDKDKMVGVSETFSLYKNLPNASFCVLPNTGHLPETMRPDRIKFELQEFLSQ